jgi:hypothetical protein
VIRVAAFRPELAAPPNRIPSDNDAKANSHDNGEGSVARPSRFTAKIGAQIVRAKRQGDSNVSAARKGSIGVSTLYEWLERGSAGDEPFATFIAAFRRAEQKASRDFVEAAAAEMRALLDRAA